MTFISTVQFSACVVEIEGCGGGSCDEPDSPVPSHDLDAVKDPEGQEVEEGEARVDDHANASQFEHYEIGTCHHQHQEDQSLGDVRNRPGEGYLAVVVPVHQPRDHHRPRGYELER